MIKTFDYTDKTENILFCEFLKNRNIDNDDKVSDSAARIVDDVRRYGDAKLFEYTRIFDGVLLDPSTVSITKEQIEKAYDNADPKMVETIKRSAENIRQYHKRQIQNGFSFNKGKGSRLGQIVRALQSVGFYVPGGSAPLPSSVLMNAIPAKIAGVKKTIMVTPPKKEGLNPYLLIAAAEAGVDEIYTVGGAQAIAALAYGTETIPKVDKITGPGNVYVAAAKRLVFGVCDIDMIAGPSEICIIADDNANIEFIAADLLSQAEHDANASSILITTSENIYSKICETVNRQLEKLERREIIEASIDKNGAAVLAGTIEEAVKIADQIAPEHLELLFSGAEDYICKINNAGAIFVGEYSPEPLGDYFAGTNHVLPTSGTARFSSSLGVTDFIKRISYINYSKADLYKDKEDIIRFADCEGLGAHANSVRIRFGEKDDRETS